LRQLSELGRQLDDATAKLSQDDVIATGLGIEATQLKEEYEDQLAEAFQSAEGSVEAKKTDARLKCKPGRLLAQDAAAEWEKAKAKVRGQQAIVRALGIRIDIGRSLVSHEKSLMALGGYVS
jgi:hypothetical protein